MTTTSFLSRLITSHLPSAGTTSELADGLTAVAASLDAPSAATRPFLTVLLRTQGHRLEPFRDAMLSLAAQTDRDFNVVVIGHDVNADRVGVIQAIVDDYAELLPDPAQFVLVNGGTRARPLNAGFNLATGEYVAVFDDDDLIFANWVEEFHAAAGQNPGQLLRAQTATQQITAEVWHSGEDGFRTLSWPLAEYAPKFDQLDHLAANRSPFMSIAFPRRLFTDLGVQADEMLDVCEDWDLILQGSFLLGVADVPALTAIYHRWKTGASSYTRHSETTWRASERRVLDKLDSSVLLLAPGQIDRIRSLLGDEGYRAEYEQMVASSSWRLTAYLRNARRSTAQTVARYRVRLARAVKRGAR
jgi:hypothetical protein